jgi:cell filamentation protein
MASFMNGLNILHPFREGNGRTQRIFMEKLAKNAGFDLDFSKVSKEIMIQASIQGSKGNTKGFEIIIRDNIQSKQKNLFPLQGSKKGLKR